MEYGSFSCVGSVLIGICPPFVLQFLKSSTQATWGALFRHETLSKDPVVVEMAIKYLRACMTNLVKVRRRTTALPFPRYTDVKQG